jgi:hypothetical protein
MGSKPSSLHRRIWTAGTDTKDESALQATEGDPSLQDLHCRHRHMSRADLVFTTRRILLQARLAEGSRLQ